MTNLLLAFLLLTKVSSVYLSFTNDSSNESSNASTDDKSSVADTYENCFVWFMEGQCLEKIEECPPIYELIDPSSNRDSVYDVLVEYINGLQIATTNSVSAQLAKAHLDDKEMSALLLLLMTRPACMEVAQSEHSRQALKDLRNRTLDSLAAHLKSVGKNVDERMGQIIFLTSDFQNLGRLVKHSIRLLMTATNYKAAPKEFLAFFEQQLDIYIYNKYAVF